MEQMEQQAANMGTKLVDEHIISVDFNHSGAFTAHGESGTTYQSKSVIIATGAQAKWLGLPSEGHFRGYGVSGCATCDGFFFRQKKVMVVGGGNTAVEEALYLTNHAAEVTLLHRRDSLRAERVLQNRLFAHPKIKVIWNSVIEEVVGTEEPRNVTAVAIRNVQTQAISTVPIDGIFIAIGHAPNTAIFKGQINLDDEGYIITKPNSTETNIYGVFAAGDVQDKIYRQAVTAAGTGCMAALEVAKFLQEAELTATL